MLFTLQRAGGSFGLRPSALAAVTHLLPRFRHRTRDHRCREVHVSPNRQSTRSHCLARLARARRRDPQKHPQSFQRLQCLRAHDHQAPALTHKLRLKRCLPRISQRKISAAGPGISTFLIFPCFNGIRRRYIQHARHTRQRITFIGSATGAIPKSQGRTRGLLIFQNHTLKKAQILLRKMHKLRIILIMQTQDFSNTMPKPP